MLTKKTVIGLLTITESRQLQVRTDTVIVDDGVELARTYHRVVLEPGDDVESQDELVRALAAYLWTPDVIEQFKANRPPPPFVPPPPDKP